jgi:AcrR family transcriptional regulator
MPRPRFDRLAPDVQARILDAAADEFATRGLVGASFNAIIASAGISKGAIYYYFDDKEDLFLTVVRRAVVDLAPSVGGMAVGELPESDFWGAVEGLMAASWTATVEHPQAFALLKAAASLCFDASHSAPMAAFLGDMRAWLETILAAGQRLGEVRVDLPLPLQSRLLVAVGQAFDTWILEELMAGNLSEDDMDDVMVRYVETFRRVVGTPS